MEALHSLWSGVSAADACSITPVFFTEHLAFLTQATYQKLLPLYFPRSLKEESRSLPCLPADIGNAEGEPVVPERQIRISEKPGAPEGEFSPFLMEEMATHSSILAWRIPWTEEPGGLQSMVFQKSWTQLSDETMT